MIELPWWAIIIAVGIIFLLIVLVARLSDKIKTLRRVIQRLEGIEEDEIDDSKLGGDTYSWILIFKRSLIWRNIMVLIYTTCRDIAQAKELGKKIMRAKAAACVNIWPIESMYWWQGELKEDNEAVLLIKTQEPKMAEIEEFLRKNHTYSVPFVGGVHIDRINIEYRDWANEQIVR